MITGVPVINNMDVYDIVADICNVLGIRDKTSTIYSVFRPAYKNKRKLNMSPIIVKFVNKDAKMFFFDKYIKFNSLNLSHIGLNSSTRIYCNDGLTKRNSIIFNHAKMLQKQNKITKVATKKGQIFVSLLNRTSIIAIKSIECLNDLINEYDSSTNQKYDSSTSLNQPDISTVISSSNSRTLNTLPHTSTAAVSHRTSTITIPKSQTTSVTEKIDSYVDEIFPKYSAPELHDEPMRNLRPRKESVK